MHAESHKKSPTSQSQSSDDSSGESDSANAEQDNPATSGQQTHPQPERTVSTINSAPSQPMLVPEYSFSRNPQLDMEQLENQPEPDKINLEIQRVDDSSTNPEFEVQNSIKVKHIGKMPSEIKNPDISDGKFVYSDALFFVSPVKISSSDPSASQKVHFRWLTISSATPVVFENLDISGKIQVTARAKVIFRNCNIHNEGNNECDIEIFAGSSGTFENCSFNSNSKMCVAIRDRSHAYFNRCSISNLNNSGILILDLSSIQVFNCDFSQCKKFAVYPYKKSLAFLKSCTFHDMPGKAVFALGNTNVKIQECRFEKCQTGAISIAESSEIQVVGCDFYDINNKGISVFKNSKITMSNCNFHQIKDGNGIDFDFSTGDIQNCNFDTLNYPAIFVSGSESNPIIQNCTIKNVSDFSAIAVRCNANPTFKNTYIGGFCSEIPVISCSDFSGSVFQGIDFELSGKTPEIMVYNAAKVKVVPSAKCKTICLHESGKVEKHSFSSDSVYCLHICERTSGQTVILPPTDEHISPEFVDTKSIRHYGHPNLKVISCSCGHVIDSCPRCGNHDHDYFTFDGNNLICKTCGILDFKSNFFKCGICKIKIPEIVKPFEETDAECVICLDNPQDTIFLPCGHKCTCYNCANQCMHHKRICPICQKKISCFKYDFFPSQHK